MSRGYSTKLAALNQQADISSRGVALGRLCIAKSIPVADVATSLGVSRQTVYNWFCGEYVPQNTIADAIDSFIAQHS
jgi:transcriptional regulator with XRE-family HTH domain